MAKPPPLIIEQLESNSNLLFMTLIEYKRVKYLTIIDNVIDEEIHAFVIDQLDAEGINTDWFMSVATDWFYRSSDKYPLSFEFAKRGAGDKVQRVLKTFPTGGASRVIGRMFVFNMQGKPKVKRRKVQALPDRVSITLKTTS